MEGVGKEMYSRRSSGGVLVGRLDGWMLWTSLPRRGPERPDRVSVGGCRDSEEAGQVGFGDAFIAQGSSIERVRGWTGCVWGNLVFIGEDEMGVWGDGTFVRRR